jgi:hypothetical protein
MVTRNPQRESGPPTTPQRFPDTTPSFPSSDYSFTLQAVMEMQKAVGALTEAVTALQKQSIAHDGKLDGIGQDVHTAKITVRIIGAVLLGAIAFAGWGIGKAVDVFVLLYQQPHTIPQQTVPPPTNSR